MTSRAVVRLCLALAVALTTSIGATATAQAIDDPDCTAFDPAGVCFAWWSSTGGHSATDPRPRDVGYRTKVTTAPLGETECRFLGQSLACVTADGWWDGHCWVSTASTNPADQDYASTWLSHKDGAVLRCAEPADTTLTSITTTYFWSPAAEPPDTTALAEQAIQAMNLESPGLGMWPGEPKGMKGSPMAIVNLPQWFFAANPGPGVTSDALGSATAGGYTVDAVATYVDTVWYPADGSAPITCGLGTKPEGVNGNAEQRWESPTCGHTYQQRGNYFVMTATHLRAVWTGAGHTGVIGVTLWEAVPLHVGEIQVVNTRG